jgi:hypothetical protein
MFGPEFKLILFNKNNIKNEFFVKNHNIFKYKRGGGYWLWKPYIIHETLKQLKDNDILFYMDSKYYFIENFTNLYSDYMKHNDIMLWKNKPNDNIYYMKNWCKMDVIHKYSMEDNVFHKNAEDCWAGAFIIKKNETTVNYVQEWLTMCCVENDITDIESKLPNDRGFIEHRHDQTLLSMVVHKYGIPLQYFEKRYLQNVRNPF